MEGLLIILFWIAVGFVICSFLPSVGIKVRAVIVGAPAAAKWLRDHAATLEQNAGLKK